MSRRGLSLLEVATVVAILGVLMAMTLPALTSAGEATRKSHCMTNLRQMARAAWQYAAASGGHLPPALLYGSDADALSGDVRAWDWWRLADGRVQPGPLWDYADGGDRRVLQCPTAPRMDPSWEGDPVTGYNYNVAFVAAEARTPGAADAGLGAWALLIEKPNLEGGTALRVSQCRRSGTTALFGTGGRRGGVNKLMRSPIDIGMMDIAYAGGQSFPGGSTNVAWIDGHVAAAGGPRKGMHWDALPGWVTASLDWPENGFLSDDRDRYDPR